MSSFVRRIIRTQHESRPHLVVDKNKKPILDEDGKEIYHPAPARLVHYNGRGSKLGVKAPEGQDKALVARLAREEKRKSNNA